jgi:hypothetical protein
VDLLGHLKKLLAGGYFNSMLKIPLAAPTLYRLVKTLTSGGVIIYPDGIFGEIQHYRKSVGVNKVRRNAIQIPFDAYRKRPRGLLYVRETLYLAGAAAALVALLFWIF